MTVNSSIFNAYFRLMRKAAYAYNQGHNLSNRRKSYWAHQYLNYAKRACILALQLPQDQRITFQRFVAYDRSKNKLAFTGTFEQALSL